METGTIELSGLFVSALTSATILPGSSEAIFTALLWKGRPWLSLLLVASIGNWIGGMSTYFLGRLAKWSWLRRMGVSEEDVKRIQPRIERWGSIAALAGWLPIIGDLLMVALGYFRVSWMKVVVVSYCGRLLRYAAIVYVTLN